MLELALHGIWNLEYAVLAQAGRKEIWEERIGSLYIDRLTLLG